MKPQRIQYPPDAQGWEYTHGNIVHIKWFDDGRKVFSFKKIYNNDYRVSYVAHINNKKDTYQRYGLQISVTFNCGEQVYWFFGENRKDLFKKVREEMRGHRIALKVLGYMKRV